MRAGSPCVLWLAAGTILLQGAVAPVVAARTVLAPVSLGGELYYAKQRYQPEAGSESASAQYGIRLNARSFIVQPWIATWDARLDFATSTSQGESSDSATDSVGGAFNLRLFPRSHFPAEIFFQQNDSRIDNDTGFFNDTKTRRFGVSQHYRNRFGANFFGIVERLEAEDVNGSDSGTSVRFGASQQIKNHNLRFDFNRTDIRRSESDEPRLVSEPDTESTVATLGHRVRLPNNLTVSNNLDYAEQIDRTDFGTRQGYTTLQYDGFANWVSPSNPKLRMTGTLRASEIERSLATAGTQSTRVSVVTAMNYDLSERVDLSGSAGVHQQGGKDFDTRRSYDADVGLTYRSVRRRVIGFDYDWSGSARASLSQEEEEEEEYRLGIGVGHAANRALWGDERSNLQLRLSQRLSLSEGWTQGRHEMPVNFEKSRYQLDHSVGLNWSRRYRQSNFLAGLSITDSRRLDDSEEAFSMAALSFNGNHSFSRDAHLSGSISFRRTTNERESRSATDSEALTLSLRQTIDRLFGVPNLRFRSDLRMQERESDEGAGELDDLILADRRAQKLWSNELDYRIGRLNLSLELSIAEHDGDTTRTVRGRVSRRFGR